MMTVIINGATREIPPQLTITAMLALLDLDEKMVIVEINQKIIKRHLWPTTLVHEGDVIELLSLVGGG